MLYLSPEIIVVCVFTFIINLIGALAYSIRIVAVNTGKVAVSFALFNILILISRTANMFQAPVLARYVEKTKDTDIQVLKSFYFIIGAALLAMIAGTFLIPTFQRIFNRFVKTFEVKKSIPKVIFYGFHKMGKKHLKEYVKLPSKENITNFEINKLPKKILLFNVIAIALITITSLAPMYASYKFPEYALMCLQLTGIINGFSTILMFIFIDPYISMKVDDVICGKMLEKDFRKLIIGMLVSRVIGAIFAFFILIPATYLVYNVANFIDYIFKFLS